jgi:hypothetical protein
MGLAFLEYLVEKRLLLPDSHLLDIGPQNLYNATPSALIRLARQLGSKHGDAALAEAAERITYFSTPRPNEQTAFVADLLALTTVTYLGYDVVPSPGAEIFDLNVRRLPENRRGTFDVVLNFGTTEHLINQLNAFEVMHEATKVGGVILHQSPSVGWIDHGYFNYNALFMDDLVSANDYQVVDRFYTLAGQSEFASKEIDIRDPATPLLKHSGKGPGIVPNFNLNYFVRKTVDAPFYVGLEIATTHAPLSQETSRAYGERRRLAAGEAIRYDLLSQRPAANAGQRTSAGGFLARLLGPRS